MAAETSPSGHPSEQLVQAAATPATVPLEPRYGKEVVGKRLRVLNSKDNTWRTGQVTAYHGGYYRHTIKYDETGETEQNHTYALQYQFLPEPGTEPLPDLLNAAVSVLWDNNKWYKGTVVGFDGLSHTVVYDDGDTQHVTLQKDRYKVLDGTISLPPKPRSRSASKAAEQGGSGGQQGSQAATMPAKQLRTNISNPLAASRPGANKPASKAGSALSGGGGSGGGVWQGAAAADGRGDAYRPLTREERERRGGSVEKERTKFNLEAAGRSEKRLPQLNMSHVSKKDREAARMLLGFSTPTAGEGIFASSGYGDGKGSSIPAAPGRAAIAAAAAAAAAAAGLPDPGELYGSAAADDDRHTDGVAAAAAGGGSSGAGSPTGSGAGGGQAGTSGVSQLTHEVLSGMQWQMQQLVDQEEQRWLEVTTLQTKVARLQRERDEARSSRDHVMVERDVALQQVRQLQDEKAHLASQVHLLQDEAARLLGQLSAERGMSSNAALDAAAVRTQVSSLRSELTHCKTEVSQLLAAIRQPTSGSFAGALGGLGSVSGLTGYGGVGTMGGNMGGNLGGSMAAAMMGYGSHSSLGGMENAAAAAAAAAAAPAGSKAALSAAAPPPAAAGTATTKKGGGLQRLGPSASGGTSFRLGGTESASRLSGKGNLMQMGPGTLVVGPRTKQQQAQHHHQQQQQQQRQQQQVWSWSNSHAAQAAAVLAASESAAAAAASLDAIAAAASVPELAKVGQQEGASPHPHATASPRQPGQQEEEHQVRDKQEQSAAAEAAVSKPAGGNSAALNNSSTAEGEAGHGGADAKAPGLGRSTGKPAPQADEALLTTSEAALAGDDDGGGDALSQPSLGQAAGQVDAANGRRAGRPSRKPLASGSNLVLAGIKAVEPDKPKATPTTRKRTRASAAQEQHEPEQQQQQEVDAQAEKKVAADAEAVRAATPVALDWLEKVNSTEAERAATPLSVEAPSTAAAAARDVDDLAADEVMASAESTPVPAAAHEEEELQRLPKEYEMQDAGAGADAPAAAGGDAGVGTEATESASREGSVLHPLEGNEQQRNSSSPRQES